MATRRPQQTQTQTAALVQQATSSGAVRLASTATLTAGTDPDRHVVWEEGVVDNEFLNRKKSKVCCIFHKARKPGESSSDSESSSQDDDGSKPNAYERQPGVGKHHGKKKKQQLAG